MKISDSGSSCHCLKIGLALEEGSGYFIALTADVEVDYCGGNCHWRVSVLRQQGDCVLGWVSWWVSKFDCRLQSFIPLPISVSLLDQSQCSILNGRVWGYLWFSWYEDR